MSEGKPLSLKDLLAGKPESTDMARPEGGTHRVCAVCGVEKPSTSRFWPNNGKSLSYFACLDCRGEKIGTFNKAVAKSAKSLDEKSKKAVLEAARGVRSKVDLTHALRKGVGALNVWTDPLLAELQGILADPTHRQHDWAFQFVMERIMPLKVMGELGLAEAGLHSNSDGAGAVRPTVHITISTSAPVPSAEAVIVRALPPAREHEIIDVTPANEERSE